VSNAHTAGLAKDLHLVGNQFNQALTYYQITFIILGPPVTIVTKQFGSGYTLPAMLLVFGAASLASGFVTSFNQLVACRVIVGAAEAGFLPS
jgi:predicted MFS family arabinose efflux permease